MALSNGTRLGNYEILAPLGAGGMGEVYRARDLRLGRAVAIKALPDAFARDPERLVRFEREARLLASVHHANIATIFGIEDVNGSSYLALELVEGETLSQRLSRGPLSVTETLEVGAQIASAIDASHEQGIVHRDLKPGNVMLTPSGTVKVLDFGLAKGGPLLSESGADLSASPTVMVGSTAMGVVLGTASYMSPEQGRGKPVDRRADVWGLGAILFECLTARKAFDGETASDVLARVLERDPDWGSLPPSVPSRLRDLIRRCLTKAAADRPRDAGDLRGEMLAIASELSQPGPRSGVSSGPPSLAVLYLQNQSTEPDTDYFCDGITEDILTDLSKMKGMRVASRSAVARFRGTAADTARVASELGVSAVLEGSVRRSGARVRINVQLVSADGFQLWGERYDRTLDDVFEVQGEIASAIAGALRVALTPAETERLAQGRANDGRAYDLYLKGREQYRRYTPESLHEAIRLFQQAIAIDPAYALAYAGLGDAHGQLLQHSDETPDEHIRLGLEFARRAMALDPRLPEAHKAEALVLGFSGDRAGCETALRRAIQSDPRFVPALSNLGVELFRQGNLAGAERMFRRCIEIEPGDPHQHAWLAMVTAYTGRLDESERLARHIRELSAERFYVTVAHMHLAMVLALRHQPNELSECVERGRKDGAEPTNLAMIEAFLAAGAGRTDEARRRVAQASEFHGLNFGGIVFAAIAALEVGDAGRAVAFLRRRIADEAAPVLVRLDPLLHRLVDDDSFAPRRAAFDLIWPVEAPMIDPVRLRLFRRVIIESGAPEGSDILSTD